MATNEIIATTDERYNIELKTAKALSSFLQSEIGLSPLATGTKFETDDLVKADGVKLVNYDWVEYLENADTPNEKRVRFALWAVDVEREDGSGGHTVEHGYYQGGTVLNKIASALDKANGKDALIKFGVRISCKWGKTSSKNDILLVTVL